MEDRDPWPDDIDDDLEDAIDECGIVPDADGMCMLAGTEHCDFVCPFRDGNHPYLDDEEE